VDILRAKELLKTLADGVNPLTGEALPPSDSCNQPDIIRALYTAVSVLDQALKPKKHPNTPEKFGKPWTNEDDRLLSEMYDKGLTKKEICDAFQRTEGSIAARLVQLGKIPSRDVFRYQWK